MNESDNPGQTGIAELKLQFGDLQKRYDSLKKSSDRYAALYNYAPSGSLALNDDGMIVEGNEAAAKLLGVEQNKLTRHRFANFIADEYKNHWNRHGLLTKQSRGSQSFELRLLKSNGVSVFVQLNCVVIAASGGSPQLLLITLIDIDKYKQEDEAIRVAAVAFEMQDGVIVTDANKNILRVNKAFTRITGFSPEEVLGNNPSFLCVEPDKESLHQVIWVAVLNNGYWQGEVWEQRKNGDLFPVLLTLTAIIGKDRCVTHYVCSITDITAQKQAERLLLDARHRLENQVISAKEELEKVKQETADFNAALTVLLKHQESHKMQFQQAFSREVEETLLPFLKKLKGASAGRLQSSQLLSIIETNLLQLTNAYGHTGTTLAAIQHLTPLETQVASMVRQGMSTKVIATTLNISVGTVSIHRNHIRKKLGLNSKSDNLQTYLKTLLE